MEMIQCNEIIGGTGVLGENKINEIMGVFVDGVFLGGKWSEIRGCKIQYRYVSLSD